jgi:hypothetical protein
VTSSAPDIGCREEYEISSKNYTKICPELQHFQKEEEDSAMMFASTKVTWFCVSATRQKII